MDNDVKIEESWKRVLADEFEKPYFHDLRIKIRNEYENNTCYPTPAKIFQAFNLTPIDDVKVAILGQDPYHGKGQAMGLSFSVPEVIPLPPSLKNIFKEIEAEGLGGIDKISAQRGMSGDLTRWATQGVLLLNSVLSVRSGSAGSHAGLGWEEFTDSVISRLSEKSKNIVFMLWGSYAKKKSILIDSQKHLILESPHPSPFSAYSGFFGNGHFNKCNDYLIKVGKDPINWN